MISIMAPAVTSEILVSSYIQRVFGYTTMAHILFEEHAGHH